MLDQEMKELVKRNLEDRKEKYITEIQKIINYPFNPGIKYIYLQFEGYGGIFGFYPFSADATKDLIDMDEKLKLNIGFRAFDSDEIEDEFLIDDLDQFARKYIFEWFRDLFIKNGGDKFPITVILHQHDSTKAYHLQKGEWIDQDDEDFI